MGGQRRALTAVIQDRPGKPLSRICSVSTERHLAAVTIRLYGEFDISSEKGFRDELETMLDGEISTLVIDLRELTFMDSTGLRAIIALHQTALREGYDHAVLCGDGSVRRVLEETGLTDVLPIVDPSDAVPR
jgi:anti-anti-sigma factor